VTSPVADSRDQLELALTAAGLLVLPPSGAATPPCVFVIPGDPWLAPATLGGRYRTVSWRIVGLVGTGSEEALQADSEAMAQALSDAIHASPPWTLATIQAPTPYDVGGVAYVAVIAVTTNQIATLAVVAPTRT